MNERILENLAIAIKTSDNKTAEELAKQALEQGINPLTALDVLTAAIREVGEKFGCGELFLPDLIGSAEAMKSATAVLETELRSRNIRREVVGRVVIGTVQGDIHDIGKAMVSTLLAANGFEVHDLGVNVTADKFIDAVKMYNPDILALSSLLTTTAPMMITVINQLTSDGLREKVKIIVGGGAITPEFAEKIGSDGYDPTAPGAVELARRILSK